ncbi:MAG TPA: restriction endonuclease subunit R [Cryomorphaceae bacterium]|nr:restriction endonuclease subunit R [Owenweeksia sp.]MBF99600.1 restriction endonuclease subunit R [Owenweeksia sp.]HAD96591.1 restriction endonuclease subunit R [Cryomorphaceae bacterium]HCQ15187.1 restriction endonuclease subunit R [Cryomorphaceae bacterium]
MELKDYQKKVTSKLKEYLLALSEFKDKYEKAIEFDPDMAKDYNFPRKAWEKAVGNIYHSSSNGIDEPLPELYLKVPTGGGKTILACHSIDHINKTYLKKQTGLVLWIVPTSQIYRQTLTNLRNREHPYRQVLDISSGGRTLIKEKTEHFSRLDTEENLVILLLMLPSANRQNKDTLKIFQDSGAFTDFFPPEDNYKANEALLEKIPNLDYFGEENEAFGRTLKTSMGNTLKVLQPIVIVDEGHKAYSENARNTIRNFNPCFILELSATPPKNTNKLVEITGRELNEEEMIKLDIHLTNKTSLDWKDTMLSSVEKRDELEKRAVEYEQNTGENIRPINLIQVERTGKDQREGKFIHSEDVKEFLIKQCNIPEDHIAIKSSEKDDIEGINLFDRDCPIRYIITKQALQEGWDCSFAYILTILTNPSSQTGITQLIGRILRQPNARKTKVRELDECYVYTFRQNAASLVKGIKSSLESEGLGDIAGRVSVDSGDETEGNVLKERIMKHRPRFKEFEGKIYLPKFVIQEKESWRDIIYEVDILGNIDYEKIDLDELRDVSLSKNRKQEQELILGLSEEERALLKEKGRTEKDIRLEIDDVFMTRQIVDLVPNPWIGYELGKKALEIFREEYEEDIIAANFVFIIEELKKVLEKERNRLAEAVFRNLVEDKTLCFFLITGEGGFKIPPHIRVRSNKQLIREDNTEVQKSLFDYVPEENVNELERSVAIYLDEQENLLWWYRNMSKQDYHIQGWKKGKIYPDFIASDVGSEDSEKYGSVYVIETKGLHLKNDDTKYKQDVFALCNELGTRKAWKELDLDFPDEKIEFQVIFEDEWKSRINGIFS